jgi:hypothetical protein
MIFKHGDRCYTYVIHEVKRKEVGKMITYQSGQIVRTGTYCGFVSGRRIDVSGQALLAGGKASTYLRIPSGVMLLSVPFIGLFCVLLMPFLGITAIVSIAVARISPELSDMGNKSFSFGWRPGSAHLSGKKKNRSAQ